MTTYIIKKQTAEGLVPVETFTGDHNERINELSRDGGTYMAEIVFAEPIEQFIEAELRNVEVMMAEVAAEHELLQQEIARRLPQPPAPKPPAKKKTPAKK